jgi:hypothetical protein
MNVFVVKKTNVAVWGRSLIITKKRKCGEGRHQHDGKRMMESCNFVIAGMSGGKDIGGLIRTAD